MRLRSLLWWRTPPARKPVPVTPPAARQRVNAIDPMYRRRDKSCTTCHTQWTLHHHCQGPWVCCDD